MPSIVKVNEMLIKHFGIPKRQNPLPDPLDTLIATILSQNTNDNNSYKAFNNLKNTFKNWEEAAETKRSTIEKLIKVAGLAPAKSKAIKNLLVDIKEKYCKMSLDFLNELSNDEIIYNLTSYDGVGVKTASCVLLFSMDKNVCPVDTHVHRTTNRIGLVNAKTPEKTFWKLNEKFPEGIAHQFHTNLIMLGREICKPTNPICNVCPLEKVCNFEQKNFENKIVKPIKRILLLDNIGI